MRRRVRGLLSRRKKTLTKWPRPIGLSLIIVGKLSIVVLVPFAWLYPPGDG
jgi:hypothetical protein